jgi:hypothetical protein
MSQVSLPFWNEGKKFEPKLYVADLEAYEKAEAEAIRNPTAAASTLVKARIKLLEEVLGREPQGPQELKITVADAHRAFWAVWRAGQDWKDPDSPLGQPGGSAQPSS